MEHLVHDAFVLFELGFVRTIGESFRAVKDIVHFLALIILRTGTRQRAKEVSQEV